MALIWLYLQIIGTPVERLLEEEDLWTFDQDDFEKACSCLTFKKETQYPSVLQMRELMLKHLRNEDELSDWTKQMYEKVIFNLLIKYKRTQIIKFAGEFPEGCVYIAVKAELKNKNVASGKYHFHSLYKNIGAYVREPGTVRDEDLFLAYMDDTWYIQLVKDSCEKKFCFLWDKAGGWLRLNTKGWSENIFFEGYITFLFKKPIHCC